MEKDNKFDEQKAPQKNTDHAFVKVGEDGKPEVPDNTKQETSAEKKDKEGNDSITISNNGS